MTHRSLPTAGFTAIVMVLAAAASGQTSPDDLLKAKGLTRQGTYYLLDADIKLPEGLKTMRQAKKLLDDNTRKRTMLQAQIKDANATLANLDKRYREVLASLKPGLTDEKHNQIVAEVKTLESHMREGEKFVEDREAELKNLVPPTDDYVTAVTDLAAKMDDADKRYVELA